MTNAAGIPGDRIRSLIERVERIDEEIKALNEGKKEVFAEAKGGGARANIRRGSASRNGSPPCLRTWAADLDLLRTGDGRPLPPCLAHLS